MWGRVDQISKPPKNQANHSGILKPFFTKFRYDMLWNCILDDLKLMDLVYCKIPSDLNPIGDPNMTHLLKDDAIDNAYNIL